MKKSVGMVMILLFVVAVIPLLAGGKGDAAAGKAVYTKKCGTCHGPEGEPKAAIAKMLKVDIPNLGSAEVQQHSDDDLKKVITAGKGKMKAVNGLSEDDLANLIAHLRTLAKK